MGRKKIEIKRIDDERVRKVTFTKRKGGLVKKAMELSMLCDCNIGLIIFTPKPEQKLYKYTTTRMESVIAQYRATTETVESFHNGEYDKLYSKKGGGKGEDSAASGVVPGGTGGTDLHHEDPSMITGVSAADLAVFGDMDHVNQAVAANPRNLSISIPTTENGIMGSGPSPPDSLLGTGGTTPAFLKNLEASGAAFPSPTNFLSELQTPQGLTPSAIATFNWNSPQNALVGGSLLQDAKAEDADEPAAKKAKH